MRCLAHSEWPNSKMLWFEKWPKKSGLKLAAPLLFILHKYYARSMYLAPSSIAFFICLLFALVYIRCCNQRHNKFFSKEKPIFFCIGTQYTTPQATRWNGQTVTLFFPRSPVVSFLNELFVVPLALNPKCTWINQYPHLPIIIVFFNFGLYFAKLAFSLLTSWRTHHLFWRSKDWISGLEILRLGPESFFQNQWLQHPPVHHSAKQRK